MFLANVFQGNSTQNLFEKQGEPGREGLSRGADKMRRTMRPLSCDQGPNAIPTDRAWAHKGGGGVGVSLGVGAKQVNSYSQSFK